MIWVILVYVRIEDENLFVVSVSVIDGSFTLWKTDSVQTRIPILFL